MLALRTSLRSVQDVSWGRGDEAYRAWSASRCWPGAAARAATEGSEALREYVVKPAAEKARAERESYNKRASTDQDTAARGVREAMSGDRMRRLQGEYEEWRQGPGLWSRRRGVRAARMIKMKGPDETVL